MSDQTPSNSATSSSQEPKSTTPIALRTRRCETQVSFYKAAQLKQCKICPSTFTTLQKLRKHVLNHKSNTKRRKALEAINSLIQDKDMVLPSPTCSKTKEEVAPTSLFSKFKKVFPELFTEKVEPIEKVNPSISNDIQIQKKENPTHDLQYDNSPRIFSKLTSENRDTQSDIISLKNSKLPFEPIENSTMSEYSYNNTTKTPPQDVTACLNDILDTISQINTEKCIALPATSSLLELQEDLILSTSSSSEEFASQTSTPISNVFDLQLHPTSNTSSNNNLVQEQLSSPSKSPSIIITSTYQNSKESSLTCSKLEKESDLSILDFILTNSQESLDGELSNNLSPPPKAVLSLTQSKPCLLNKPSSRFHLAAKEGLCLICSKTIATEDLLQHLYKHKPCPLRAKCLEGFRSCFPPNKIPVKKSSSSSNLQAISSIELTFREKFPELPIFHDHNSSTSNSSDESILLEKMDSPPTGPPPISPFKKALYSRVVKKGLFRCQFCEKAYVSEEKAIRHKKDIHGISPHRTVAKFFPDCPPEMCRVCCKGPAPYSTIADHYKYEHNLSISTSTSPGTISSFVIPSSDFVSTSNKHIRNFTSNLPKPENKKSNHNSTDMQNTSANNNLKTKIYNNLKIVARPELRGTGPSKIVSLPYATSNKKSSPPQKVPPKITVQAEVHHKNSSQVPHSNSPRKCSLCPFIAIKQIGLRLHYFKNHGLRKIPTCSTNPQNILQSNQNKKSKFPLPGSIAQVSNSITAIPKLKPPTTGKNQQKKSPKSKKLSTIPPEISTQIYTATPIPTGDQDINVITAQPKIVLPSKNAIASQLPVVTPQPTSPIVPFVSYNSHTLQYSFPIPTRLQCPIEGCNASFGTKSWYTTNTSIKKHIHIFHKQKPSKIIYHCSICNSPIAKNPAKHSCLINNLILLPAVIEGDHWVCDICECFSATTKLAKKNHLDAHAREVIKANSSQLIIPPNSKAKRKSFNKRIKDLSEGPAGNLPLAPPIADEIQSEIPPAIEIENITKIDLDNVSILASFAEPLDAILEVDDIEEAQVAFETLLEDIISVMQNHFHLAPPTDSRKAPHSISSNRIKSVPENAQLIQRQYRWNR
ncbi:hypothetical protein NPIL_466611, partial [Nephila pilipes]